MLIAFSGTHQFGQHLGDTITSIKVAWMFAQNYPCSKYLLVLSPKHDLNFMWQKFIDTYKVQVIYDTFDAGNADIRFNTWNKWRVDRKINDIPFDIYKELYRRIDGGHRQGLLCGGEPGLGRKNIFEYFYFGQEEAREPCIGGEQFDGPSMFYHPQLRPSRDVFLAPYAKCQGNSVFTFNYWSQVVHRLLDDGMTVTVNFNGNFCEDCNGHPNYRKIYPSMQDLQAEICRHRIVTCGNTGVGWMAGACGVPLLAMQPVDSHIQDYRYEWCGVKSLVEFLDEPDADYCAKRLIEECEKMLVFTTGCYDVIHEGHLKHLEESRSLGNRLVVGLNSDAYVRSVKGEGRPHQNQDVRAAILRSLKWVDEVIVFDDSPMKLIEELHPQVVTVGPDYKEKEVVGRAFVESYGGKVIITGGERTVTSSAIIRQINKNAEAIKAIRDAGHLSPNPFHKLKLLADQYISVAHLCGQVADVGCYRGACSVILRRLAPDRVLHLFDTFLGTPIDDPLCHHKKGEWKADLKEVQKTLPPSEITVYHPGVFPDTAQGVDGPFAFVFVDCDTYQATKDAIEFFWPRIMAGGKMMFDDAPWIPCAGVEKAINEAFPIEQQTRFPESNAIVVVKP